MQRKDRELLDSLHRPSTSFTGALPSGLELASLVGKGWSLIPFHHTSTPGDLRRGFWSRLRVVLNWEGFKDKNVSVLFSTLE